MSRERRSWPRPRSIHLPSRDGLVIHATHEEGGRVRILKPAPMDNGTLEGSLMDRHRTGLLEEWTELEARRAGATFTVVATHHASRSGEAPAVDRSTIV